MTTTTPTDAVLPLNVRIWVYRAAIVLGALIFAAALVLKYTGHDTIDGVVIDPFSGIVGLILSGLGYLAHANLTNGPGILKALEGDIPVTAEVIADGEKVIAKVEAIAKADPDLTNLLRADLVAAAKKTGYVGSLSKKNKAALIAIINGAEKGA